MLSVSHVMHGMGRLTNVFPRKGLVWGVTVMLPRIGYCSDDN